MLQYNDPSELGNTPTFTSTAEGVTVGMVSHLL